ncbi:MAG: GNAT family N-acetyltransferase [Actinobacteria bacterium]|nr:GNAT family N-acetyltransferase [Actinomycetota bacterium]
MASVHGLRGKILRFRGERARLGTWRGRDGTAYLTPFPDAPALSGDFVEYTVDHMRARGYRSVVTGALTPGESLGFVDAGFRLHEELRLLEHHATDLPDQPLPTRRARKVDRPAVLDIDARCFDEFWALDGDGLDEAIQATPWSRFRVVEVDEEIAGYAVSGRAGSRGYLQRLGVDPAMRQRGAGTSLVTDCLRWMRARGVTRVLVNTHAGNDSALSLYEACGFRLLPTRLRILTRAL